MIGLIVTIPVLLCCSYPHSCPHCFSRLLSVLVLILVLVTDRVLVLVIELVLAIFVLALDVCLTSNIRILILVFFNSYSCD